MSGKIGRPKTDHTKLNCTLCGRPRDHACSRCRGCLAKIKRSWRKSNPERAAATFAAWVEKNPDKIKAYSRTNYLRHKDRFKAHARNWRKLNPKKVSKIMAFQNAKRRSRIKGNGGRGFTKADWLALLSLANHTCVYCRVAPADSIDHFVPLKRGGAHDSSNIVPACRRCNSLKRDNEPVAWVSENFGASQLDYIKAVSLK